MSGLYPLLPWEISYKWTGAKTWAKAWAELLRWTRIEPSKDVLVTLGHMASTQVEDPVTQGPLGLRNSPRSLELQQ